VDDDEVTRFRAGWERLVVDLASDTSSANTNHTECRGCSGTDASRTVRTWESTCGTSVADLPYDEQHLEGDT
jgi:hypothetical protein